MKKSKGFTIIELLAVIVIIGIILLIAVPLIFDLIDNSKEGAFKNSIHGIVKSADYEYSKSLINNQDFDEVIFTYNNGIETSSITTLKLNYKGNKPNNGFVKINSKGDVFVTVYNGKWCAKKEYSSEIININKTSEDECLGVEIVEQFFEEFKYTGDYQKYEVPKNGLYQIELWGAQGDSSGRGAYTSGKIPLMIGDILYFYVGEKSNLIGGGTTFNGGTGNQSGNPGGGATDVRLASGNWKNFDSLKTRIMVAAGSGSGSGNNNINLGYGGALTGGAGGGTLGGTQIAPGNRQSTNYPLSGFGYANGGCSGGNGYYGGGASTCSDGAGGGSSFISGYSGSNAIAEESSETSIIHTGQPNHYTEKVFVEGIMIAGNEAMPTYDGNSTMVGNEGNGFAKIKYIQEKVPPKLKLIGEYNVSEFVGTTYKDLGAVAYDYKGIDISSRIKVTGNVNTSVLGKYTVKYEVVDYYNQVTTLTRIVNVIYKVETFNYTGNYQKYIVPKTGTYQIELWGAQGNSSGRGAYTSGQIELNDTDILYFYVGEKSNNIGNCTSFNGGTGSSGGMPGGGATDVRLISGNWNDFSSLKTRIMVASGSGSSLTGSNNINLGYGGTLTGGAGGGTLGGTQIAPGNRQSTSYSLSGFGYANGGCSGGNGYYGGGASACANGAGGGSSFISGHIGSNAISESSTQSSIIHTNQPNHYSGKIFAQSVMIAGNESMPTHDGGSVMIGNQGNGHAKISFVPVN